MDSCFSSLSNSIVSEFKKPFIGFRLKLIFDSELRTQNAYIFVDLSSTPTIDTLLVNIARRFKLNYALRFTLHECEILPDEHILVLANTDEVRVRIRSTLRDHSAIEPGSTDTYDAHHSNFECVKVHSQKHSSKRKKSEDDRIQSRSDSTDRIVSPNEIDDCTNVRTFQYAKSRTVDPSRSMAKFLLHLQEDKKNYDAIASSFVGSATKVNYNVIEHEPESDTCSFTKPRRSYPQLEVPITGEMNENSEFSDIYDDNSEQKKRKRKRKHAKKKNELKKLEVDEVDMAIPVEFGHKKTDSKKHIRFNQIEEDEVNDNATGNTDHQIPNSNHETVSYDPINSSLCSRIPCDEDSSSVFSEKPSDDRNFIRTSSSDRRASKWLKDTNSSLSNTNFFSVSKLRQNNDIVEKELGTILMLKDLKSIGNYSIQFVGCEKSDARRGSQFEDEKSKICRSLIGPALPSLSENKRLHQQLSPSPKETIENVEDGNHALMSMPLPANEKLESSECEMLMQSKIVGDKIFMRTSNVEWKYLTVDSAKNLLSCCKPAEGQSIVFQVLYLKENTVPVLSNLIFGRILKYNSSQNKVVLEIPLAFLEDLFLNCKVEESINLPEGIIHVTGDVFELDWFVVKDPKLLS